MSDLHRNLIWTGLLVAAWVVLSLPSILPAALWLEVRSVEVADTRVGLDPDMVVDRTVRQPFLGSWNVDVERKVGSGRYVLVCTARGQNSYAPDNDLPTPLRLTWWTYPTDCTPTQPGIYRVETRWRIRLPGGPYKELLVYSNDFTVSGTPASE